MAFRPEQLKDVCEVLWHGESSSAGTRSVDQRRESGVSVVWTYIMSF